MDNHTFSSNQIKQIELGKKQHLDVSVYAKPEYSSMSMEEIREALSENLPIQSYVNTEYDWLQIREIRKGLREGLDISVYASKDIPYEKMRQLRRGLKEGINLKDFIKLDAGILRQLRSARKKKVDISRYVVEGYDAEQLEQIIKAKQNNVDISPYINKQLRGVVLQEIILGLEMGMNVSIYANPKYSWQQMRELRIGLKNRVNISLYSNALFDANQMREIRLGQESGLDVTKYARLMYTALDMNHIRNKLLSEMNSVHRRDDKLEEIKDEQVNIFITEDEMQAYACFDKGIIGKTVDNVLNILKKHGIIQGIDNDLIEQAVAGKAEYGKLLRIAHGKEPETGKDGWYEFFFRTELARTPKLLEDGSVDYKSVEWFEIVNEGQKVAQYHSAEYGAYGYTVTGMEIHPRKGRELSMLRGSGFKLLEDEKTYIAAMDGRIELKNNQLMITRLYIFDDITMATGNVDVDGNAYIRGGVGSNTSIRATGDIVIDGFIEAADIKGGANIFLRQGVNAGFNGCVCAQKNIYGKFFEDVEVWADGDICANYCLDSELHANGQIKLTGKKGSLVGGKAEAAQGIVAFNIGNSSGSKTIIKFGVIDSINNVYNERENEITKTKKELEIFRKAYADFNSKYSPEVRGSMDMYIKIENAIYTKEKELENILEKKKKFENIMKNANSASVIIRGMLYSGVKFEMNGMKWDSRKISGVTVKKAGNRIGVFSN